MRPFLPAALACAALLACGESDPAPRTGPVTVTYTDPAGAPIPDRYVVFHRPDGTVQELAKTDAAGQAGAVIAEGALVTVHTYTKGLVTISGVEPGEALGLAWSPVHVFSGRAAVALPGAVSSAATYDMTASCINGEWSGEYRDSVSLWLYQPSCGTSIDVLALARDAGGALVAWAAAQEVPITGTEPDQSASAILGPWRTDVGTMALDVTNAPAGSRSLSASLEPRRDGRLFWDVSNTSVASASVAQGAAATLVLGYPQGFGTSGRLRTTLSYGSGDGAEDGRAWILEQDTTLASRAVDLSVAFAPRLSGATLSYAPGALTASWQQAHDDPGLDAVLLLHQWTVGSDSFLWQVVAPPGTRSFAFPELPLELSQLQPLESAGSRGLRVKAYDASDADGYDSFRARGFVMSGPLNDPVAPVLRATETATTVP